MSVLCCRFADAPAREQVGGFTVHRIPSAYAAERRLNVPWPVPSPVRLLRKLHGELSETDVVHVQDAIYATSAPALLAARRKRVASVLTQHVAFVPQQSRVLDAVQSGALMTLGRCSRLANVVATLNPAVAAWAEEQWGVQDVRVLPVGIPPPDRSVDRAEARRSFGLPPDAFVALFIGRDVPKKGLDVFLSSADSAYRLVAVTDRPAGAEPSGATVLPFMSPARLEQLFGCVDCFVLPSEGEGFPLSLQEALTWELPVVTTVQAGYDHYLGSEDVLYVERSPGAVRDALLRLVHDPELRIRLAERSRHVADRHFGLDRFVDAYERLYLEARERAG